MQAISDYCIASQRKLNSRFRDQRNISISPHLYQFVDLSRIPRLLPTTDLYEYKLITINSYGYLM